MKQFCLVAVALCVAQPANALCHHYSKWYYPYPQPKCSGVYSRVSSPEDKTWSVEITKLPPSWNLLPEDEERSIAIEQLKEKLK
jgi:hypothetical protein